MKKILITGVSGFLGGAIFDRLNNLPGFDVYGTVRNRDDNSLNPQILSPKTYDDFEKIFKTISFDFVVHVATYFHAQHQSKDIEQMIDSVITMPSLLIEAMIKTRSSAFFINTGTSWQHYQSEGNKSDNKYNPVCLHSSLKEAFEKIINYYQESYGIKVCTLKLFDTYGKGDKRKKIINLLVDAICMGNELELSPGSQLIDLVHINDVVDCYLDLLNRIDMHLPINEYYMVSSGVEITLRELAANVAKALQKDTKKLNWGKRPYREREVMFNWRGSTILPGWKPSIIFNEAIIEIAKERGHDCG